MFVRSSLESNKKLYPWSQFIVDSNGVARGAWQLDEKSSAVVVLDKDGRVQWAKDGALTLNAGITRYSAKQPGRLTPTPMVLRHRWVRPPRQLRQ